jgi:hypothetical protein
MKMKQLKCVLLDANIVIKLFELGLWDQIIECWDIYLSRRVVEQEADYYDAGETQEKIDFAPYIDTNKITIIDVNASDLQIFIDLFGINYLEKLDPGESESLAYLNAKDEPFKLCSADKIVFRVLPQLNRADQGISLEEILQQVGLGRPLEKQFTKAYKNMWTKKGQEEMIRGMGLK